MKLQNPATPAPQDAEARRAIRPTICYPIDTLPMPDLAGMQAGRKGAEKIGEVLVPPRDARCIEAPAGSFFRITCTEGAQVGEVRGEGMLCAVEFIEDKAAGRFYEPAGKVRPKLAAHMFEGGFIARAMPQGDILGFAPPFCLSRTEVDQVVGATAAALKAVLV